jgi:hypothetical protein
LYCSETEGCYGECVNGDVRCADDDIETCTDGEWLRSNCEDGVCLGGMCSDCIPDATQCYEGTAQTCDQDGRWGSNEVCHFLCSAGACAGSCNPSTTRCNDRELQVCSNNAEWAYAADCPNACIDGSCVGVCIPDSTQSSGTSVQTCDAQGQWQQSAVCQFVCSSGACTGECIPGSVACDGTTAGTKTCGSDGVYGPVTACPESEHAPDWHLEPTCSEGLCRIACQEGWADCDGNGSCSNELAVDPNNCGICGHSCGGGACQESRCQQFQAATPLDHTGVIVSNVVTLDGKLYWGEQDQALTTGYVVQYDGTTKTKLVDGQPRPERMSSDGGRLCWTIQPGNGSQGSIVCLDSGIPNTVVSLQPGLGSPSPIHMNGQYAAWSSGEDSLREASLSTGNVVAPDPGATPGRTFVAAAHTYWAVYPGSGANVSSLMEIRRRPHTGGAVETLAQGQEYAETLYVSGNDMVWIANRRSNQGRQPQVMHMDLTDRVMSPLYTMPEGSQLGYMITVHDGHVYWMERRGQSYALMRMALEDEAPLQISAANLLPRHAWAFHLAVDNQFAYWVASGNVVMKVATTHWSDFTRQ